MGWRSRSLLLAVVSAVAAPMVAGAAPAPGRSTCMIGKIAELPVTMRGARALVPTKINGKDAMFIADSGAFYSLISPGVAAEFNLPVQPIRNGFYISGIGGTASAGIARVTRFGLAGAELRNVEFLVGGSDTGAAGLIGQNVLNVVDTEYDLPHSAIRLLQPKGCGNENLAYWAGDAPVAVLDIAPRTTGAPHLVGKVMVNGVPLRATFDTGATDSIVTPAAAARAGVHLDANAEAETTGGLGRRLVTRRTADFDTIALGNETVRHVRLGIVPIGLADVDMLVGMDFFASHRVYVANGQHRMYFTYVGGPAFGQDRRYVHRDDAGAVTEIAHGAPEADPTDADGFARRAAIMASRKDFDRALADYGRAIALAPRDARYRVDRAGVQVGREHWTDAGADLDAALAIEPKQVDALTMRASLALRRHDRAAARADLDAASAAVSPSANVRLEIGSMYAAADASDRAVAEFDRWMAAHRDDSRMAEALNGRCWARALAGTELPRALADCNAALRRHPRDPGTLDSRALVELRIGDETRALADYDAALAANGKIAWSHLGRSIIERKRGKVGEADTDLAAAVAIDPDLPEHARRLGILP